MTDDHALSRELTQLVATLTGVVEVYTSVSALRALPALPLALLPEKVLPERLLPERLLPTGILPSGLVPTGIAPDEKVAVSRDSSGTLTVTATIGVGGGHTVLDTVRRVGDALRGYLETVEFTTEPPVDPVVDPSEPAVDPPVINVRVSRVDSAQLT